MKCIGKRQEDAPNVFRVTLIETSSGEENGTNYGVVRNAITEERKKNLWWNNMEATLRWTEKKEYRRSRGRPTKIRWDIIESYWRDFVNRDEDTKKNLPKKYTRDSRLNMVGISDMDLDKRRLQE